MNAKVETKSTGLVVLEQANAVVLFTEGTGVDDLLEGIRQQASSLVSDISTAKGRKEIASVAYAVAQTKTYLDGLGKELTDKYKEIPKRIDANRKQIRDALDLLKDEVRAPLTKWEEEEKAREVALQFRLDRIAELGNLPAATLGASSAQISAWLNELHQTAIDDSWQERAAEAAVARDAAVLKVLAALDARVEFEDQQAELAILREKQAKQEQQERDRRIAEEAAQAEARRQESDRQAALQREADAKRRQEEAELRAAQLEEEARRNAVLAELRRKEAEETAKRLAEEAAVRAAEQERQRIADEQKAKADADAARAADKENRRIKNNEAASDLVAATGLPVEKAQAIIKSIAMNQIRNIAMNY